MCGATRDVRFVPIADMKTLYSMTSSARSRRARGILSFRAFAVFKLITI